MPACREEPRSSGTEAEPRLDVRRAETIEVDRAVLALVEERLDRYRDRVARHFGLSLTAREGAGFVRYLRGRLLPAARGLGRLAGVARRRAPAGRGHRVPGVVSRRRRRRVTSKAACCGSIPVAPSAAPVDVVPRRGTLVAFPATMLHEVTVVQRGVRDAIVDWYY